MSDAPATRTAILPTMKELYGEKILDQTNRRAPWMRGSSIKSSVLRARRVRVPREPFRRTP